MRLLAHQEGRHGAVAPQRQVEGHPAQHRNHHVQDLRRHAGQVYDGDGLAGHGHPEDARKDLRHVVPHIQALEHEGKTLVRLQGLEPGLEPLVGRQGLGLAPQLTHAFVDKQGEITQLVGDRRVHGQGRGDVRIAGEILFAFKNEFTEDLGVGRPFGALAAQRDLHHFLQGEQPVGKLQIVGVDDLGHVPEGMGVFIVGVEHHHVGVGILLQERVQDQGDGAGLSRPGGAEDGEVLAQQIVGEQERGQRPVLVDGADADGRHRGTGVNVAQVLLGRREDGVTQFRENGNATAE